MPWHIPEDLRYFKRLTMGGTVVMGRKTYESIGKPLPGRTNVVITRQSDFHPAGTEIAHSLEEAVARYPDAFIIGGAEIYRQALPLADRLYITRIKADYEGDTLFPDWNENDWTLTWSEDHDGFEFTLYERSAARSRNK
jgi:dihydrofolate reductase